MRKAVLIIASALFVTLGAASCKKDYTCSCTYIPNSLGPNAGQPNKEESTNFEARQRDDVSVDCLALEGKYITQFYSGSCVLQ